MTRTGVRLRCLACGHESPQWLGRCPGCGEWGSLVEAPAAGSAAASESLPLPIAEVDGRGAGRVPTGVGELDRVLGGGLVAGSVTLLSGEPGMGKSTLLLQALGAVAAPGQRCLLVSAEESAAQVRLRADRLGTLAPDLFVVSETSLPAIAGHIANVAPAVCAIDSIQTVHDPEATGAAGSVTQVRDGAQAIVRMAKSRGMAVLVVGHVTKDGGIAGPRALEHVVDTVLSFEGDRHHELRMLRALKHRFGPTDELGLLRMTGGGLAAVDDPSALFLGDRRPGATGSVVTCTMEGSRPLCVEVQALVSETGAPVPRRVSRAVEPTRLAMLLAVLHERARVAFDRADVYVSVAGGVRLAEPGADLAVTVALVGARIGHAVPDDTVVIGEVGLGGEVRQVPHLARRVTEAQRLGFRRAVVPPSAPPVSGIELVPVADVAGALRATVGAAGRDG
ncbi:MAG: DNA repair protein RadA [Actinomycetota bacterium]